MLTGFPFIQYHGRQQYHSPYDQTASVRWATYTETDGSCFTRSDAFFSEIHSASLRIEGKLWKIERQFFGENWLLLESMNTRHWTWRHSMTSYSDKNTSHRVDHKYPCHMVIWILNNQFPVPTWIGNLMKWLYVDPWKCPLRTEVGQASLPSSWTAWHGSIVQMRAGRQVQILSPNEHLSWLPRNIWGWREEIVQPQTLKR
jgi:hypothetical protein